MPRTEVVFFQDVDGSVPMLVWLDGLPRKVQIKCIVRIERLGELGHEIRRPEGDFLRDGIYELRVSFQGVNYRMLYFFSNRVAVLSHGLVKESQVPPREIDRAVERMRRFAADPGTFTYVEVES